MKIRFYGGLGERLGREIDFDLPCDGNTVAQLRDLLSSQVPGASTELLSRTRACIGETVVGEGHMVTNRDMVEFFPPLSGG